MGNEWTRRCLVLVAGLLLTACGSSGGTGAPSAPISPSATPTVAGTVVVRTASATVAGKTETVLTDTTGMTLYYFTPDTGGKVTCTGQCALLWPPLLLPSGTPAASGSLSGQLATVDGPLGRQVTYQTWPLYTWVKDKQPGDTTGQGVSGKWFVATPQLSASGG